MKNKLLPHTRFVLLTAVLGGLLPLRAASPVEAPWNQVCRVAHGHPLTITTSDGVTLDGYCVSINVDEIAVNTKDRGLVKVARSALSRIEMRIQPPPSKGHELATLGRGMRTGLRDGFKWLFSPSAVLGIVTIPATLAWGAVTAPFCVIGDLKDKLNPAIETKREIKVL